MVLPSSEKDARMLRECKKFGALGLKVKDPKKIGHKVFDVENEMTNEDLMKKLYEKNLKNAGVNKNKFKERVRVVSRTNRKGMNVGNVEIEMSKRMRDVLVREGRVYVKWRACKVKEFVNVLQCHKCFAFGHMMRNAVWRVDCVRGVVKLDIWKKSVRMSVFVEIVNWKERSATTWFCPPNSLIM